MYTQLSAPAQRKSNSLESLDQIYKASRKRSVYNDYYCPGEYQPLAKWAHLEEPSPSNEEYIEIPLSEKNSEELSEPSTELGESGTPSQEEIIVDLESDNEEVKLEQQAVGNVVEQYVNRTFAEEIYAGEPNTSYHDMNKIKPGFTFPGTAINVIGTLGKGAFGKVVESYFNGSNKAMKFVKHTSWKEKVCNEKEALILSTIAEMDKENFFVGYFESFVYGRSMCFVMEKMDLDLQAYMHENHNEPLPADVVIYLAKQTFEGLSKLWDLGYAHADVKPNNILLVDTENEEDPWRVKIADFGNAIPIDRIAKTTSFQAPIYRCPELQITLPGNDTVDTWSTGATVFYLYTGEKMFTGWNNFEILRQIHENTPLWYLTESEEAQLKDVEARERVYSERGFDKLVELGHNLKYEGEVTSADLEVVALMTKIMQPNPEERPTPKRAFEFLMEMQDRV